MLHQLTSFSPRPWLVYMRPGLPKDEQSVSSSTTAASASATTTSATAATASTPARTDGQQAGSQGGRSKEGHGQGQVATGEFRARTTRRRIKRRALLLAVLEQAVAALVGKAVSAQIEQNPGHQEQA